MMNTYVADYGRLHQTSRLLDPMPGDYVPLRDVVAKLPGRPGNAVLPWAMLPDLASMAGVKIVYDRLFDPHLTADHAKKYGDFLRHRWKELRKVRAKAAKEAKKGAK